MKSVVDWFEIPATDIQRAARFYGAILDTQLEVGETNRGYRMAMLPTDGGNGGAIIQGEGYVPSDKGAFVWLHGGEDLSSVLNRVEAAGGQVLMPKTSIGEHGFSASFLDTEGNRIGLHSTG